MKLTKRKVVTAGPSSYFTIPKQIIDQGLISKDKTYTLEVKEEK